MRTIRTYECELCGKRSGDKAEIENCERIPMKPTDIKPGDVVIIGRIGGSGYGWWKGSEEWFLRDDAGADKPLSKNHHRRLTIGHPKYAVLDILPYKELSMTLTGEWAHRYAAVLYSPDHANRETRIAHFWHGCDGLTKVGEVTPGALETFRAAADKLTPPTYGSY